MSCYNIQMRYLLLSISILSFLNAAMASDVTILEVYNEFSDEKDFISVFKLRLNSQGEAISIIQEKKLKITRELINIKIHKISSIHELIVLERRDGFDVITLSSDDFDIQRGGTLNIRFLKNALLSNFGNEKFYLINKDGNWYVQDDTHKVVESVTLYPNWVLFLGTIGIDNIFKDYTKMECSSFESNPC